MLAVPACPRSLPRKKRKKKTFERFDFGFHKANGKMTPCDK
jgi:hypothetical protein